MNPSIVLVIFSVFLISHIPTGCKGNPVEITGDHKQPLDLICSNARSDPTPVKWFMSDKEIVTKPNEYEVFENHTLRILKIEPKTVGPYVCKYNGSMEMAFKISVRPSVEPFDKVRNVIQGDPLRLDCKAWGVPAPIITWFRDEVPLLQDAAQRITLKPYAAGGNDQYPEVQNGTIRIVNLDYPDIGNYSCFVTSPTNSEVVVNATVVVQVKDKYAALWPFLGICVEVAVLCTIILIYERRRAKRIEEEERQEESAHLNANNEAKPAGGNDEVRQRK